MYNNDLGAMFTYPMNAVLFIFIGSHELSELNDIDFITY